MGEGFRIGCKTILPLTTDTTPVIYYVPVGNIIKMADETVYTELDVPHVVNAVGDHTRIGGTLIRSEALEAMRDAGTEYVSLYDLQASASRRISEITGSEAGLVTNGAGAGLVLAAAAAIAGTDYDVIEQLPRPKDVPDEILVPQAHYNEYNVTFRAAGGTVTGVGHVDMKTGTANIKPWELDVAIDDNTVALAYVATPRARLSLEMVSDIAHSHDVPVIVDAAAELPPTGNLTRFIDAGADAVVFSGGKAIRGPQSTGILAGTRDIVESAALLSIPSDTHEQLWNPPDELIRSESVAGMPNHGIGRPLKVGKEELVGLLRALELFIDEDDAALFAEWNDKAHLLCEEFTGIEGLDVRLTHPDELATVSEVLLEIDEDKVRIGAAELIQQLREEDPRIYVGERRLDDDIVVVNPKCLTDDQSQYIVERARSYLE